MNQNLNNLLSKEVSRRDFLIHVGTALVALVGITGFLQSLRSSVESKDMTSNSSSQVTYGTGAYAGNQSQPNN